MKKYFYEIFILDTENNVVIEYYLKIEVEDTVGIGFRYGVWSILIMVTGGVNVQLSLLKTYNPMIFWLRQQPFKYSYLCVCVQKVTNLDKMRRSDLLKGCEQAS